MTSRQKLEMKTMAAAPRTSRFTTEEYNDTPSHIVRRSKNEENPRLRSMCHWIHFDCRANSDGISPGLRQRDHRRQSQGSGHGCGGHGRSRAFQTEWRDADHSL